MESFRKRIEGVKQEFGTEININWACKINELLEEYFKGTDYRREEKLSSKHIAYIRGKEGEPNYNILSICLPGRVDALVISNYKAIDIVPKMIETLGEDLSYCYSFIDYENNKEYYDTLAKKYNSKIEYRNTLSGKIYRFEIFNRRP